MVALALGHRDEIRGRAERALGRGMPAREAELARGFVLGEDERIDAATVEDFRRAGLSHLLAVSGQNVALLALLAMPLLAALGMPLRTRLRLDPRRDRRLRAAGRGRPLDLRAGVMGAISVLATLAGRRASRLYALALAAIVTLGDRPGIGADVGWQLSFAAVLGILALAAPLRGAIAARHRRPRLARRPRRGSRGDRCRDAGHGAADRLSLRSGLDRDSRRQPAGAAGGGAGDVAGNARRDRRPGARLPGRAPQRAQRAPARLHRPGGRLVRPAELGLSARESGPDRPDRLLR